MRTAVLIKDLKRELPEALVFEKAEKKIHFLEKTLDHIKASSRKSSKNLGPPKNFKKKNTNEPKFFSKNNHQYNFCLLFSPFKVCGNSKR